MKRFLPLVLFLCLLAPVAHATEFLRDTFTGTNDTNIANHTGDSGAGWVAMGALGDDYTNYGGGLIENNRLAGVWVGYQWGSNMRALVTPPSAEYDITAVIHVTSVDGYAMVTGRELNGEGYEATIRSGGIDFGHRLSTGNYSAMGDCSFSWVPGNDYTIRLEIKNAVKNVYVDGVLKISNTSDNWLTGAGSVAVNIGGGDVTTGFQIDSIVASTDGSTPPAPVVSGLTATTGTVGTAFTSTIQASNNPSSYAVASGSLPAGLSLNTTTGAISGTPTGGGSTFTVTATNAGGTSPGVSFTITINPTPPSEFLRDTFTDTNGTNLIAHTGESGTTWTGYNWADGDYVEPNGGVIANNRLAGGWVGFQWGYNMRAMVTPPSAEYDITAVVHVESLTGELVLWARYHTAEGYFLRIHPGGMDFKYGCPTGSAQLGNADGTFTWVAGHDYTIRFEIKDAVKNVYVDNVLQMSETSNNWITTAGSIAVSIGSGDATTGFQIDSIVASTEGGTLPAPVVSNLDVTTGIVGTAFTSHILASNNPSSYAVSGTLPPGLSFNGTTGTISGTPTGGSSTFTVTVTATNAGGTSPGVPCTITINAAPPPPDQQAPAKPTDLASSAVTASSFTLSWSAPFDNVGVTGYEVSNDGGTTAIPTISTSFGLSGLTQGTPYSMTVRAHDAANNWSTWSDPLVVRTTDTQAPTVPTGLDHNSTTTTSFTLTWDASNDNVGPITYKVLKDGVPLTPTTTGTSMDISGLSPGTSYAMTVLAIDAASNTSAPSTSHTVTTGSGSGSATEFLRDTFTDTNGTNLIAHTGESGTTWTGYNWADGDYVEPNGGVIANNRLAGGWVGFQWGYNMRAMVTPPSAEYDITAVVHVESLTGELVLWARYHTAEGYFLRIHPGGMDFKYGCPTGSAQLGNADGTFTWVAGHDYTIRFEIKDAVKNVYVDNVLQMSETSNNWITTAGSIAVSIGSGDATTGFQIDSIVASTEGGTLPAPVVSNLDVTTGIVGTAFTSHILASNNPSSYAVSGTLPPGLSFNGTTGTISGTPTGGSSTFTVTVTATNAGGTSPGVPCTITINAAPPPAPVVSGLDVITGTVGTAFTSHILASNNPSSYAVSGTLPPGLSFNGTTGTISGTPTGGSSTFTVTATNAGGTNPGVSCTININAAPPPPDQQSPAKPTNLAAGAITASGFTLSWSVPFDNVGVTGYEVSKDGGTTATATINAFLGLSGLTQGTPYSMTVRAHDAANNWSPWSDPLLVRTTDTQAPTVPTGLNHTSPTTSSFTLTWDASNDNVGPITYTVLKDGVPLSPTTTGTSMDVSGLSPGTTYAMTVLATDAAGNTSAPSGSHPVTTDQVIPPTLLVMGGNNQTAPVGQFNALPFDIAVVNPGPQPLAGVPVTFTVQNGGGLLATSNTGNPAPHSSITLSSDQEGTVQVYYQQPSVVGITSQITVTAGLAQPLTLLSISSGFPGDEDANGLLDAWELRYFGHTGVDPNADPDGDHMVNRDEMEARRNPGSALDAFSLPPNVQLVLPTPTSGLFFGIKISDWTISPIANPNP